MILDASLNEVETLAAKAARGAGLPWGLAEDAAKAARWLAAFGLPWPETLLRLLAGWDARRSRPGDRAGIQVFAADGASLSPLICGPYLGDRAADFAADRPSRDGRDAAVASTVRGAGGFGGAVPHSPSLPAGRRDRRAAPLPNSSAAPSKPWRATFPSTWPAKAAGEDGGIDFVPVDRARVPTKAWGALEVLAARTYVPASERSRALGAGVGRRPTTTSRARAR